MPKKSEMSELKHDHDYCYDMAKFFSIFADPTKIKDFTYFVR